MSEERKEKMLELLSEKAVFGLSEAELAELAELKKDFPELDDDSFELAAASIGMLNLDTNEQMPVHLREKIAAGAEQYFAARQQESAAASAVESRTEKEEFQKTFAFAPKRSIWSWLGWLAAGAACLVLAFNIYTTRSELARSTQRINELESQIPKPTPKLSAAQELEQFLAANRDVVRSEWGDFDPNKPMNVKGEIVWSSSAQKGYIRFTSIPVNDKTKEQYQLWIFDENQNPKTPIDGGVFDANQSGEVIVPIDAKIKVQKPTMFAVTAEKPGGVVVSPLEKVMAVAKVPV
jgi:anti-sigma-K factor RskA